MKLGRHLRLEWLSVFLLFVTTVACSSTIAPELSVTMVSTEIAESIEKQPTNDVISTNTPLSTENVESDTAVPTETTAEETGDELVDQEQTPQSVVTKAAISTDEPTVTKTVAPTDEPTVTKTVAPTDEPTVTKTVAPTDEPTATKTVAPTDEPTATKTVVPTDEPTPLSSENSNGQSQATNTPWPTNTPKLYLTNTPWPTNAPKGATTGETEEAIASPSATKPAIVAGTTFGGRPATNAVPGAPAPYLSRYQMITFYGSPWGSGLGILGDQARSQTNRMLREHASWFQSYSNRHAMPTYHMITTVANPIPPKYRHHVDFETIDDWIAAADANGFGVIMDIQPGRVDVLEELERIRYTMYNPHVHLAIDPEFMMNENQVPNYNIGQATAEQINAIQAELNQIALEIGVNKVLMIHQFKDSMVPDKENIQNYPHVELLIDSDGTFNSAVKMLSYEQYGREPGFEYGGIKVFYNYDDYVISPDTLMSLEPQPAIVIYQ